MSIKQIYGGRNFVRFSFFCLLAGLGSTLGFVTQFWPLAVGLVAILAPLAYLLSYRKILTLPVVIGITISCTTISFGLGWYTSALHYDQSQVNHLWLIGDRVFWLGRQIDFGLILGSLCAICSIFCLLSFHDKEGLGGDTFGTLIFVIFCVILPAWLVVSTLASIFGWGFGFGFGWYFNLLGFAVPTIAGLGLAASIVIWRDARKL